MSKFTVYLLLNIVAGLAAGLAVYSLVGGDLAARDHAVLVMALIGFETFTVGGALLLAGARYLENRRLRLPPA